MRNIIRTEYWSYDEDGDFAGMRRGFPFKKGTLSYWIIDKLIQWNISKADRIRLLEEEAAHNKFRKFKQAL